MVPTIIAASPMDRLVLIGERFGLDPVIISAQALNFCIVAAALYYFGIRPVLRTMDERKQKIADGLQYAEEMKEKLAEAERRQQEMLRKAQQDAQQVVAEARNSAKAFHEQQLDETKAKVADMIERARADASREHDRMLADLRQEVANLVVQTSARVLQKELTPDQRQSLNKAAANQLASTN